MKQRKLILPANLLPKELVCNPSLMYKPEKGVMFYSKWANSLPHAPVYGCYIRLNVKNQFVFDVEPKEVLPVPSKTIISTITGLREWKFMLITYAYQLLDLLGPDGRPVKRSDCNPYELDHKFKRKRELQQPIYR